MTAALQRLLLGLAVLVGLARRAPSDDDSPPEVMPEEQTIKYRAGQGPAWAEPVVAALLLLAAAAFVGFVALLIADPQTQLLALMLGGGLAALAFALVLAGARVVPQEKAIEPRPPLADPDEETTVTVDLTSGFDGVSRRKLLGAAAGTAGTALGAAILSVPLTQAGPGSRVLDETPWRAGTELVDDQGRAIRADVLAIGGFLTAFPRGADPRQLGAPIVVARVDPATLQLPRGREGWAPLGLVAYSKICTHAGCAVSLYRSPTDQQFSSGPALSCPCHYSTFDVRRGARVIAGPAGRPLPQLPLRISPDGELVAAGKLSGSVGPAWWGTQRS